MKTSRKLLVLTNKRKDGQAFSPYSREVFNNVVAHAEKVCGRWDDISLVGTDYPKEELAKYPDYDVLLVGNQHAELITELSPMNLSGLEGVRLTGILVQQKRRRIIATPSMNNYGVGEAATSVRASLLGHLYRHLELLSIGRIGWDQPEAPAKHRLVKSMDDWKQLKRLLYKARVVAIDSETTSLQRINNTILTLQFGFDGYTGWVVPFAHPESPLTSKETRIIIADLKEYFERGPQAIHVGAKLVFDLHQIYSLCKLLWYNHKLFDLQISEFNLDENRQARSSIGFGRGDTWGLERFCIEGGMDHYHRTKLGKSDRSRLESKPLEDVAEYGGVDVVLPIRLMRQQRALAAWRNERMPGRPYERYSKMVVEVGGTKLLSFAAMERNGLKVDIDYVLSLSGTSGIFLKEISASEAKFNALPEVIEANELLLERANIRSTSLFKNSKKAFILDSGKAEHKKVLFIDVCGLEPVEFGKSGEPKFDKDFKAKYKGNKVVDAFADLVEAKTLYGTFIKGWYKLLRSDPDNSDGRLHTVFSTINIKTSRSGSSAPNLQNIPERSKRRAKIVKRQIITEDENLMLKRDFSSHETRLLGISAKDKGLALAYWTGMKVRLAYLTLHKIAEDQKEYWSNKLKAADLHRINYGTLYGVKPESVTDDQRSGVKGVIFGVTYGFAMPTLGRALVKPAEKRLKEINKELKEIEEKLNAQE